MMDIDDRCRFLIRYVTPNNVMLLVPENHFPQDVACCMIVSPCCYEQISLLACSDFWWCSAMFTVNGTEGKVRMKEVG